MKLTEIEIKGRTFDVYVNDNNGSFSAVMDAHDVKADSLAELKSKLAQRISRSSVKINIPFVRWENKRGIRKGTINGLHASNKNTLVKWSEGGNDQEYSYSGNVYVRPEVAAEYAQLAQASADAHAALDEFVKRNQIDAKEAIQKAMQEQGVEVEA